MERHKKRKTDLLCLNQKELLIQNAEYEIALATEKLKLLKQE